MCLELMISNVICLLICVFIVCWVLIVWFKFVFVKEEKLLLIIINVLWFVFVNWGVVIVWGYVIKKVLLLEI